MSGKPGGRSFADQQAVLEHLQHAAGSNGRALLLRHHRRKFQHPRALFVLRRVAVVQTDKIRRLNKRVMIDEARRAGPVQ